MARKIFSNEFIDSIAEYCAEHVGYTYTEIGEQFEIDRTTAKKIIDDNPRFYETYHAINMRKFKAVESLAIQKLYEKIAEGNVKMIQYALDGIGYKASEKVEVSSNDITVNIGG